MGINPPSHDEFLAVRPSPITVQTEGIIVVETKTDDDPISSVISLRSSKNRKKRSEVVTDVEGSELTSCHENVVLTNPSTDAAH